MNHKFLIVLAALMALCGPVQAQMTDEQIIEYVQQGVSSGKNQQQLGRELLLRGATQQQLLRLKTQYEQGELDMSATGAKGSQAAKGRSAYSTSSRSDVFRDVSDGEGTAATGRGTDSQPNGVTGDAAAVAGQMPMQNGMAAPTMNGPYGQMNPGYYGEIRDTVGRRRVFGRSVFTGRTLTFEPNGNMATPKDYRLGPGDEVIVEVWGANEDTVNALISPEGSIMVEEIGPVYLNGLTVAEAERRIRGAIARKYAGISGEEPASQVREIGRAHV